MYSDRRDNRPEGSRVEKEMEPIERRKSLVSLPDFGIPRKQEKQELQQQLNRNSTGPDTATITNYDSYLYTENTDDKSQGMLTGYQRTVADFTTRYAKVDVAAAFRRGVNVPMTDTHIRPPRNEGISTGLISRYRIKNETPLGGKQADISLPYKQTDISFPYKKGNISSPYRQVDISSPTARLRPKISSLINEPSELSSSRSSDSEYAKPFTRRDRKFTYESMDSQRHLDYYLPRRWTCRSSNTRYRKTRDARHRRRIPSYHRRIVPMFDIPSYRDFVPPQFRNYPPYGFPMYPSMHQPGEASRGFALSAIASRSLLTCSKDFQKMFPNVYSGLCKGLIDVNRLIQHEVIIPIKEEITLQKSTIRSQRAVVAAISEQLWRYLHGKIPDPDVAPALVKKVSHYFYTKIESSIQQAENERSFLQWVFRFDIENTVEVRVTTTMGVGFNSAIANMEGVANVRRRKGECFSLLNPDSLTLDMDLVVKALFLNGGQLTEINNDPMFIDRVQSSENRFAASFVKLY